MKPELIKCLDIHAKTLTFPDSLYRGRGQVVSINDTGFDLGSIEDVHSDFTGRIRAIIPFSSAPSGEDTHSHGTHVAGSVLGSGYSATMGGIIEGTAPEAELVMQKVIDASGAFRPGNNYIPLLQGPYGNYNSRISSNSWGVDWRSTVGLSDFIVIFVMSKLKLHIAISSTLWPIRSSPFTRSIRLGSSRPGRLCGCR